jgi:hypothetical protein
VTAAPTLAAAAGQAFDNLQVRYAQGTLKTTLTIFWGQNLSLFPEATPDSHPVSNWLTVLAALAALMPTGTPPLAQLTSAAEAVYRLCWMASYLQGTGGITNTQAATLLASYNTVIGFP